MKAKILLVLFAASVMVLLVARLVRPSPQTAPDNPPTNKVVEAPNPTESSQADLESTRTPMPQPPQRQNVRDAQGNWANQSLPPGTNLQEQLQELARRRGVPLNVLTQQLATELSNAFSQELNRPVDFYGKVVDESGAPLSGATARIRCLVFPESQFATNISTGADGLFTLHGVNGQALSVTVAKDGYVEPPGTNEHHFAYYGIPKGFQPDAYNPVVFVLRNKESGQK